MSKYYVDFVGLNTFIYDMVGYNVSLSTELNSKGIGLNQGQNMIGIPKFDGKNPNAGIGYDYSAIEQYKNYLFPQQLPTTASFFPALMLHRNGPYGFPMWKQTRVSQNPLTRRQIKENIFTIIEEPGAEFSFLRDGKVRKQRARFGNILKFDEVPVTSKFKSMNIYGSTITDQGPLRVVLSAPVGNSMVQFNNYDLNERLGLVDITPKAYEDVKKLYLNGALTSDKSPFDVFEVIIFKECVYPPQVYTYKNYVRQRTTFTFPWRNNRLNRSPTEGSFANQIDPTDNDFGSEVKQSIWNMDSYLDHGGSTFGIRNVSKPKGDLSGYDANRINNGYIFNYVSQGILQNQYSFGSHNLSNTASFNNLDNILRTAPIYNRKQILTLSASAVNFNGMNIEGLNTGTLFADIHPSQLPAGEAKWEAASQSGKAPFYDSYDDFIQGPRQLGKDYSIVPEFKISDHVGFYQTNSTIKENLNFLEMTGGLTNTTGSNQENFFKIYTNSDFMKNFEMVLNDNESMGEPLKITLKCNAIKKLLPYEGFYPQQRTVQIAKQFYDSYSGSLALSGSLVSYGTTPASIGFQNVMVPMFAPGLMFNSIKSGVAVDYPLVSNNLSEGGSTNGMITKLAANNVGGPAADNYYCGYSGSETGGGDTKYNIISDGLIFDKRLPFETLIQPENLQGIQLFCNEPDLIANHSSSATINSTVGDKLYSLMTHNFLAETSNFFLQNKNYTTFFSKPSNELQQFEAGKDYMMRVKMYKSTDDAQISNVSGGVGSKYFTAPQYSTSSRENFTMYSRPTAFGPPSLMSASHAFYSGSRGEGVYYSIITDPNNALFIGNRSDKGENYPFTPPYYHGQAWADIKFTPATDGAYSVKDILNQATTSYYRYVHPATDTGENIFDIPVGSTKFGGDAYPQNNFYNKNALQLSASVNLFSIERDEKGAIEEETARWVIQTKWETPMLNFNAYTESNIVSLPLNASQSVPRGMWHQYGLLEENQSKGVFMQIEDVDPNWLVNILGKSVDNVKSLRSHLDFSSQPKRLGEVADQKVIREAVVAVPFIEENGFTKYFHIPRNDIDNAFLQNNGAGDSVTIMLEKMQRYVFPPSMDFITNDAIDPFAMYIFEFSQTLSKEDLADIWQGLYPKITRKFETSTSEFSHPLLAKELLGGGATILQTPNGQILDNSDQGTPLPSKTRWMVFKVKQKAAKNYWQTVLGTGGNKLNEVPNLSFNWPYDFCSLVELAKLDAEVAIGKFSPGSNKNLIEPQGKITEAAVPVSEALTEEAQSSVSAGVPSGRPGSGGLAAIAPGSGGSLGTATGGGSFATADNYDPSKTYNCSELRAFVNAFAELANVSPNSQSAKSILSSRHRTQLSNC